MLTQQFENVFFITIISRFKNNVLIFFKGLLVRKLKEGGSEKSIWQPEVNKLLALKGQLAAATGAPVPAPQSKSKKK